MRPRKLTRLVTASLLGLSVLPLLLLSLVANRLIGTGLDESVHSTLAALARSLSLVGSRAIEPAVRSLESLGEIVAVTGNRAEIRRFIDATRLPRREFDAFALLDAEGRIVELSPRDDRRLGDDLSGQPGYLEAKREQGVVFSPSFVSSIERKVTVAALKSFGETGGIVLLNLATLGSQLDRLRVSNKDSVAIVDAAGRYIAHTDMDNVYEQRYARLPAKLGVVETMEVDGVPFFAISETMRETGWRLVYYRDAGESTSMFRGLALSLVLVAALTIGVAIILALFIQGRIRRPFAAILGQIGRLAEGNYGRRISGAFPLELGTIAAAINGMADKVERRDLELQRSEERYRALFFGGEAPALLIENDTGRIRDANRAACLFYGWAREELLELRIWDINLLPEEEIRAAMRAVAAEGSRRFSFRHRLKDGGIRDVETFATIIEIDGIVYTYSLVFDVTDRIAAEAQVLRDLEEKTLLLKEIHHRVKNNLQIVSSLFYLQAEEIEDQSLKDLLRSSEDRIQSMSLAHEVIYQSPDLGAVDMERYLEQLVYWLTGNHPVEGLVVDSRCEPIELALEKALACGLIINELVTNALVHGMPATGERRLVLRLLRNRAKEGEGERVLLEVRDFGPGLPPGLSPVESKSLGFSLVRSLTQQLGGRIEWSSQAESSGVADASRGFAAKLSFPPT
jgi:PAS domain S-box-containing protein